VTPSATPGASCAEHADSDHFGRGGGGVDDNGTDRWIAEVAKMVGESMVEKTLPAVLLPLNAHDNSGGHDDGDKDDHGNEQGKHAQLLIGCVAVGVCFWCWCWCHRLLVLLAWLFLTLKCGSGTKQK